MRRPATAISARACCARRKRSSRCRKPHTARRPAHSRRSAPRCAARSPAVRGRSMQPRCCAHRAGWPTSPSRRRATAAAFRGAVDSISELGGAHAGDRTMLDALVPAVAAFERALDNDRDPASAWAAAVEAAEHGAQETARMTPRAGRASYRRTRDRHAGRRRGRGVVLAACVADAHRVRSKARQRCRAFNASARKTPHRVTCRCRGSLRCRAASPLCPSAINQPVFVRPGNNAAPTAATAKLASQHQ